jgi:NADH dehydrogenase [ubiquinone] 1 alpha subcomplex assembly factor 5
MDVRTADAKVTHRNFAASLRDSSSYDYLRDAVAASVVDRLTDITREFPVALDLGANTGNILKHLDDRGGVKKLFMLDSSRALCQKQSRMVAAADCNALKSVAGGMLDRDKDTAHPGGKRHTESLAHLPRIAVHACNFYHAVEVERIVGDEDGKLPFEDKSLDLVMSSMSLHWSNKIEGVLTEVKRVLKPDGVFLGAMLGGETLHELKYVHFFVGCT